jgi:hypothetical protein
VQRRVGGGRVRFSYILASLLKRHDKIVNATSSRKAESPDVISANCGVRPSALEA